jgi:hypothetical protein
MQICRGFTAEQWTVLRTRLVDKDGTILEDENAWRCAVEVFERRIRERFLSCICALERSDSLADIDVPATAPADCSSLPDDKCQEIVVPGFAILALCCLLIETLQSFREQRIPSAQPVGPCTYPQGPCIRPEPATNEAFRKFLRLPAFGGAFSSSEVASRFVGGVRNGILHDAETRRWAIWRNEPSGEMVEKEGRGYALNRTAFRQAVTEEFERYLADLRTPENVDLRKRFVEKVDRIVKDC